MTIEQQLSSQYEKAPIVSSPSPSTPSPSNTKKTKVHIKIEGKKKETDFYSIIIIINSSREKISFAFVAFFALQNSLNERDSYSTTDV